MPSSFAPFRSSHTLLLFGGKGGVGKTTLAAATALRQATSIPAGGAAAASGTRVLLLSTDPAHSLRDSLAAEDEDLPDALDVEEFAAAPALDAFRTAHRETLKAIVEKGTLFDDADIERLLDLSLPGFDEVMAFLHLADRLQDDAYRTIVVDTAPTGHALRLLDTPDQFSRWLDVLDALLEKHRYMRSVFGSGGSDSLDAFISDMRSRAKRVHDALQDADRCRFCLVAHAEPAVLDETAHLLQRLNDAGIPVSDLVLNQWAPASTARRALQCAAVQRTASSDLHTQLHWWTVPSFDHEVRSVRRLQKVATALTAFTASDCAGASSASLAAPTVRVSAPLPRADLLFVGGKGGVGKTTLAAATALRRADSLPRSASPVLLVSTDPAHSLGTVLDRPLSDTPSPVAPGVQACEINAESRFAELRQIYLDEVRQFFDRTGGATVDLTYDRPVMEHLMDLAPPGLDEIMGLTAVMDFLDANAYAACVVDAAPTGHLVRLLEMPDVLEDWIRAFFQILQKYRNVLHLPDVSAHLVTLSKQVKALRHRLDAPEHGALLGVTLPTEMAAEETRDLAAHAARLGIPLSLLVVNRVAKADAAPPLRHAHAALLNRYRRWFTSTPTAVVSDGHPPQGVEALRVLGSQLYPAP